jgi:hypothetical protein
VFYVGILSLQAIPQIQNVSASNDVEAEKKLVPLIAQPIDRSTFTLPLYFTA